jgi:retron-type reverse transcriptase
VGSASSGKWSLRVRIGKVSRKNAGKNSLPYMAHRSSYPTHSFRLKFPWSCYKGSETAGIDGTTKSNFLGDLDGNIKRLRESLKAKTFEPTPVKRVYILMSGHIC